MTSQIVEQIIAMHILRNISRSKDNQRMKFEEVKHVRLHWNSKRWNYCHMYESYRNTELPEEKNGM